MQEPDDSAGPGASGRGEVGLPRLAWWGLVLALVLGGVLRCVWAEDMEWKTDEQWTYRVSREAWQGGVLPRVGMETSLGFPNPGLSVWVFVAIARVATTPTAMVRVVQAANVLALLGFVLATRAHVPVREREPWYWAFALQAVNPFAVRLSRKIWPPSVLPPFLLMLWIGHMNRGARWGAFLWGLAGALIGQIHLSGWYVAAALVLGTVASEVRGRGTCSSRWGWWLVGSALGLAPAAPWVLDLLRSPGARSALPSTAHLYERAAVCLSYLEATPLGLATDRGLGLDRDVADFMSRPVVNGVPTYLNYLLHWQVVTKSPPAVFTHVNPAER